MTHSFFLGMSNDENLHILQNNGSNTKAEWVCHMGMVNHLLISTHNLLLTLLQEILLSFYAMPSREDTLPRSSNARQILVITLP